MGWEKTRAGLGPRRTQRDHTAPAWARSSLEGSSHCITDTTRKARSALDHGDCVILNISKQPSFATDTSLWNVWPQISSGHSALSSIRRCSSLKFTLLLQNSLFPSFFCVLTLPSASITSNHCFHFLCQWENRSSEIRTALFSHR